MSDTFSEMFIVCPYCEQLHEFEGSHSEVFFTEGKHDFKCDSLSCQKEFKVNTETAFTYETEELEEEGADE